MTVNEAKKIILQQRGNWNVMHLIFDVKQRGNIDAIQFKEKKVASTSDQTALDNFLSSVQSFGLTYKGIPGVGFDYNADAYSMMFTFKS